MTRPYVTYGFNAAISTGIAFVRGQLVGEVVEIMMSPPVADVHFIRANVRAASLRGVLTSRRKKTSSKSVGHKQENRLHSPRSNTFNTFTKQKDHCLKEVV